MANVPYDGSGPTVAPDVRAPDDYQRIDVNPDQFGAAIGRGAEQLGQGITKAQQFYGQVAADNATNDFQDFVTKKLNGDPSKQVLQPDGTMGPDTGYMGLRGRAALDARPQLEQDINDHLAQIRGGLTSPEQQLQFDSFTRRYRANAQQTIGSHAETQFSSWSGDVNKATGDLSLQHIAASPLDGNNVANATSDLVNARIKDAQMKGGGPELIQEAQASAKRDALRAQVEAVGATDPGQAIDILNKNRAVAGVYFEPLKSSFQGRADQQAGTSLFNSALSGQQPAPNAAAPTAAPQAANGLPQEGPMPPARGDGGQGEAAGSAPAPSAAAAPSTAQPTYQAWRAAASPGDRREFDRLAQVEANKTKGTLPAGQQTLFGQMVEAANAKGVSLHGAPAPMAAASPSAAPSLPPGIKPPTPYDLAGARSRINMGQGDAEDKAWVSYADAGGGTKGVSKPGPEVNGRDTSPAPVGPPAYQALPKAYSDPNDRSHSLPAPTPGGAALPYFTNAGAPYGISGNYLARTKQIESGSGSGAGSISSAGAQGPFQFIPSTWARYGNGGNPNDFGAATAAAVRLAADNKNSLTRSLGRPPSDAELYLAHQQGAGGAAKLLRNPNVRAGDLVGDRAIKDNGGDPNAPASAFVAMWGNKFNGIKGATGPLPMFATGFGGQAYYGGPAPAGALPPIMPDMLAPPQAAPAPVEPAPTLLQQAQATPQVQQAPPPPQVAEQPTFRDPKADVYDKILSSGDRPEVIQHAIAAANQHFAQQQIADEQDQRAKKERSDDAFGRYTQAVLQGNLSPQIISQVASDPNLLPETKWTLTRAIREESARQGGGDKDTKAYGPGFYDALKGISAPEGDPSRITDDSEILRRAGPDGNLTFEGAEKLISAKHASERSIGDTAVNRTKTSLIDYAKQQLSFDQETIAPGYPGLKDPKGAALFSGTFVPKFEAAYDEWVKAGKSPWEFLTRDNVDKMTAGMRSKRAMDADRVSALGDASGIPGGDAASPSTPDAPAAPPAAAPPAAAVAAPKGYDSTGWSRLMSTPPVTPSGAPIPVQIWSQAVRALADDPTPERIAQWNASKFGRNGYDAYFVLRQARPDKAPEPQPAGYDPLAGLN